MAEKASGDTSGTTGAKWDMLPPGTWVKARDLVGVKFHIVKVSEANIGAEGKPKKPSFVVAIDGARQFSVGKERSTMATQFARSGIPPIGDAHTYTVEKVDSDTSPEGYGLVLREV